MAKKGKEVQLQVDITNDEDWENLLKKDGLIVVDVYSDWCGPCSGMQATLKKVKLEIGGDTLILATARTDNITQLKRFRGRSEPAWLFISQGQRVNFMFGANAPKLTQILIDELKKEFAAAEAKVERIGEDISTLTPEEKDIFEVAARKEEEENQREQAKIAEELFARRTKEANNILDAMSYLGCILIFPFGKTRWLSVLGDQLGEAGLSISRQDKVNVTAEILKELFYFGENPWSETEIAELFDDESFHLIVKPKKNLEITDDIETILCGVIYGSSKVPPGDPDSPAYILARPPPKIKIQVPPPVPASTKSEEFEGEEEEGEEEMLEEGAEEAEEEIMEEVIEEEEQAEEEEIIAKIALWTPPNPKVKATCLRLFARSMVESALIPEPEPVPPYYAFVYELFRKHEILPLMQRYPKEVMHYGFFTDEAKLIAKTAAAYAKAPEKNPNDKLVIQLSAKKSECLFAFFDTNPTYASPNVIEGKKECREYFPDDYEVGKELEEELEEELKIEEKEEVQPETKDQLVEHEELEEEAFGEEIEENVHVEEITDKGVTKEQIEEIVPEELHNHEELVETANAEEVTEQMRAEEVQTENQRIGKEEEEEEDQE